MEAARSEVELRRFATRRMQNSQQSLPPPPPPLLPLAPGWSTHPSGVRYFPEPFAVASGSRHVLNAPTCPATGLVGCLQLPTPAAAQNAPTSLPRRPPACSSSNPTCVQLATVGPPRDHQLPPGDPPSSISFTSNTLSFNLNPGEVTSAIVLGDVNADGVLDAVVGIENGANKLMMGTSSNDFPISGRSDLPGGNTVTNALALGDMNG